jgi:hypothetical protein
VSEQTKGRRRWIIAIVAGSALVTGKLARRRARERGTPADAPADVGFMRVLHSALRRDLSRLEAVAAQATGTAGCYDLDTNGSIAGRSNSRSEESHRPVQ